MSPRRPSLTLVLVAAVSGCGGDDRELVPADVARIAVTPTCVPLAPASRVLGVSSEGELWLVDGASRQTVVLDAAGASHPGVAQIDDASGALPWSDEAAALIVDGGLWTVTGGDREFVPTPPELGRIGQLCGDPTSERGAFVASDQGLFERLGGFWWRWTPSSAGDFGDARELVRNDGSCVGQDDTVWMVTTAGRLWQISAADARIVAGDDAHPVTAAAAAGALGAAALQGDRLRFGPPWHDVEFASGTPRALAAGGGGLWVLVDDAIYQRQDSTWRALDGALPGALAVHPHAAGGAWIEYADRVCHAALGPALVIRGLRPYEHRVAATASLTVASAQPTLTVARDGTALTTVTGAGAHALADVDLGPPGWHQLSLTAGSAVRTLDYDVVDLPLRAWATDVQPIFAGHCTGGACHGPMPGGTQVDLSTYAAWRARAGRIRERLLRGQMPPVGPLLDPATLAIVLDWIEGGMKP